MLIRNDAKNRGSFAARCAEGMRKTPVVQMDVDLSGLLNNKQVEAIGDGNLIQ